jgi:Fur family ferric uptake transcriptional regulator
MGTPTADRVTQSLKALAIRGERVTAARRAVIEVLDGTTEHLTADEIAVHATRSAPGVHRATVYRALTTLGEIGIVSHTHVAGSATIYHLTTPGQDPTADHAHVQCTSCSRIIDIDESALAPLERTLRKDIGFRVDVHHAAFLGTCADCLASLSD